MFNKTEGRNQIGFNLGGSITDLFIPYLTIGAEYTRVNPFVYTNLIQAQTYRSYNYSLGDWMGNNFDKEILFAKYTPIAKLKSSKTHSFIDELFHLITLLESSLNSSLENELIGKLLKGILKIDASFDEFNF
jgi:hypothetical protein